ncbi:unnamed protein product [Adineta steineri]|uniref:Cadmium resistance transporter n=1 Tax=Adineta steineri TaxID=433720 RepID=A0A814QNA0_9BILA|nr:unnamed protein product [Adineta steineri]CAF1555463.1 unnamed protein product [Adineta steineri]
MHKNHRSLGEFFGTAFITFIVTNIDDIIVLMGFFTEAATQNSGIKVYDIFFGQYLGFSILLVLSLIGYATSYILPVQMLGFLGFLPIILGIKGIINLFRNDDDISASELESIRSEDRTDGDYTSESTRRQSQDTNIDMSSKNKLKEKFSKIRNYDFNIQTLKVAGVTIANGIDNIAIYTPLFAQASKWQIVGYIGIFLLMVFIWLIISYCFISYKPILSIAQKYARYIIPVVFIGIGIYILIVSDCFPWLERAIETKNFKNG